jgi:hypothetical protein
MINKIKGTKLLREKGLDSVFPIHFKLKGVARRLEIDQMREEDFEEAAMKVAVEMAERQALMRGYKIPPEIIFDTMRA